MLVLTRKDNESVQIGNDIQITMLECRKGNVRIGIKAPKDVHILRSELIKKVEPS